MYELVIIERDHMKAVAAAAKLRKLGVTAHTFLTGSLNTQRKKAEKMSAETVTLEDVPAIQADLADYGASCERPDLLQEFGDTIESVMTKSIDRGARIGLAVKFKGNGRRTAVSATSEQGAVEVMRSIVTEFPHGSESR